jgi:hypothetical protein
MSASEFIGAIVAYGGILVSAIASGVTGAWLVWTRAPPVGGEWWPYIRGAAAIIGGVVGLKVGALVATVILGTVVGMVGLAVSQ